MHFKEGEELFHQGDKADRFFVLRSGRVALEIFVPQRGALPLDVVGEGEVLGVSWLIPPYRWFFDARAKDSVSAVSLDGKCLRQKCEEDPRLGYELMKRFATVMSDRLQATRVRLIDIYSEHNDDASSTS